MNRGGSKSQIRRSHLNISSSRDEPLDAATRTGAGLSQSHIEQSPAPVRSAKRRGVDVTVESELLPVERVRRAADVPTEPLRRSARLQTQQPSPSSEECISPSAPVHEPQAGQRNIAPPSKRDNTQQSQVEQEVEQAFKQLKPPKPLTKKNLALFDKMGKKKMADSTDETRSTKTTSTTTSGFADKARNNGILHPLSSKPPKNREDRRKRHAAPRDTASPPESVYNDHANRVRKAHSKATMVVEMSKLLKNHPKGYRREYDQRFTNYPKDVGFNNGLSAPQPDLIEGLEEEEYRPFPVADHVPGASLYKDDPFSVTLPHIAGEWKAQGKGMEEAIWQSAYDGAAMVYAINQALAYIRSPGPCRGHNNYYGRH